MSKTYLVIAALLAMTAQAYAGPVLGGSTLRVSSSSASTPAVDLEEPSWFSVLLARFEMVANVTTGNISPTLEDGARTPEECDDSKHPADEKNQDDKDARKAQNGPEPIYFAF